MITGVTWWRCSCDERFFVPGKNCKLSRPVAEITLRLIVNGEQVAVEVEPGKTLLQMLREDLFQAIGQDSVLVEQAVDFRGFSAGMQVFIKAVGIVDLSEYRDTII